MQVNVGVTRGCVCVRAQPSAALHCDGCKAGQFRLSRITGQGDAAVGTARRDKSRLGASVSTLGASHDLQVSIRFVVWLIFTHWPC